MRGSSLFIRHSSQHSTHRSFLLVSNHPYLFFHFLFCYNLLKTQEVFYITMNKEEKAKLWSDRIQQYQTSGQTCKQWCAENGIPLSTMGYWIRRLAKEEPASESERDMVFVRLPSEQEAARKLLSEESSSVRIFISDSIRIEISDSCRPELMESILGFLQCHA